VQAFLLNSVGSQTPMKREAGKMATAEKGVSLMDSILGDINQRGKEAHSKQLADTRQFFTSLPKKIIQVRLDSEDEFEVELEARFGKVVHKGKFTSFRPELQQTEYDPI
jgi:hypothetical protein